MEIELIGNWSWIATKFVELLNSNFTAALAGAFAGAWAAQKIADRQTNSVQITEDVRRINLAIGFLTSSINTLVNLKRQHVRGQLSEYLKQKAAAEEHFRKLQQGLKGLTPFHCDAQFVGLSPPRLSDSEFRHLMTTGLPLSHRGILLASSHLNSAVTLIDQMKLRNDLIDRFQQSTDADDYSKIARYFGLPVKNVVDARYANSVESVISSTDDCLQFAIFLVEELVEKGQHLRDEHQSSFGGEKMAIYGLNLAELDKDAVLPDRRKYLGWEKESLAPRPPSPQREGP